MNSIVERTTFTILVIKNASRCRLYTKREINLTVQATHQRLVCDHIQIARKIPANATKRMRKSSHPDFGVDNHKVDVVVVVLYALVGSMPLTWNTCLSSETYLSNEKNFHKFKSIDKHCKTINLVLESMLNC